MNPGPTAPQNSFVNARYRKFMKAERHDRVINPPGSLTRLVIRHVIQVCESATAITVVYDSK